LFFLDIIIIMKFSTLFSIASTAALALAAPTTPASALSKRADYCGQWDNQISGPYTIYNVRNSIKESLWRILISHRTFGAALMPPPVASALALTDSAVTR
jgi:hypothetical protein